MEDPAHEIAQVVNLITAAVSPEIQQAAVLRYYAPDVAFRHPLCAVPSGPGSRDTLLGILQWYRVMSPRLKVDVGNVTYNASTHELFVEVVQVFHIRWNPFPPAPARLLVHLVLRKSDETPGLWQIALHEDFYHPDDIAALVVPPLIPVIKFLHTVGTVASNVNARVFGLFGFWSIKDDRRAKATDTTQSDGGEGQASSSSEAGTSSDPDTWKSKVD